MFADMYAAAEHLPKLEPAPFGRLQPRWDEVWIIGGFDQGLEKRAVRRKIQNTTTGHAGLFDAEQVRRICERAQAKHVTISVEAQTGRDDTISVTVAAERNTARFLMLNQFCRGHDLCRVEHRYAVRQITRRL